MNNTHLHIKDALCGASPGTLIASSETRPLHGPLRALLGEEAATLVLTHTGQTGILFMSEAELTSTTGIALELAQRLVAARRLFDACRHLARPALRNAHEVLQALPFELRSLEVEVLLAVALNAQLQPMGTILLAQGGPSSAVVVPRYVFTPLVRLNARCFVLAHNHPSGSARPSEDDIVLTNAIAKLGYALDLHLVDHLIVGHEEVCSFADLGLLPTREELARLEVSHGC